MADTPALTAAEKLELAIYEADKNLRNFEHIVEKEARAAAQAVRDGHAENLSIHQKAKADAVAALRAFTDAHATHPWEGKRVSKTETTHARWGSKIGEKKICGIVEVRRTGTQFPGNMGNYRYPAYGAAFVRLLKKDGTPGTLVHSLGHGWQLDEEGK